MLKLVGKKNNDREEEEKTKDGEVKKVKKSPAEIRWRKEIGDLDLPDHAVVDFPDENDICNFFVTVDLKNEDCVWKGGKYRFSINIPKLYPHSPPKVHCDTQIYHPNINMEGAVCLNILRDDFFPNHKSYPADKNLLITTCVLEFNFTPAGQLRSRQLDRRELAVDQLARRPRSD